MSRYEDLRRANPAKTDDGWGESPEGQAEFARVLDGLDTTTTDSRSRRSRPWLYAAAGFAGVALVSLPLWFSGDSGPTDPLALPGDPYGSINDDALADGVVTEGELLMAAGAVVSCTEELSAEPESEDGPESEVEYVVEPDGRVSWTTLEVDTEVFEKCHFLIFRGIEKVWALQNLPPRAEDFYLYGSIVACTESRTGEDFGEMTRDPMGFISTVGHRTINAALDGAEEIYNSCFDSVVDQVLVYTTVLDFLGNKSGETFPELGTRTTESRSGVIWTSVDEAGFETLDDALEKYPDLFLECLEIVLGP